MHVYFMHYQMLRGYLYYKVFRRPGEVTGSRWIRAVQNWLQWRALEEAFVVIFGLKTISTRLRVYEWIFALKKDMCVWVTLLHCPHS